MTSSTTEGSAYVINPKPLGRPVCRSFITTESIISPYFSKYFVKVSTLSATNIVRIICFSKIEGYPWQNKKRKRGREETHWKKWSSPKLVSLARPPTKIFLWKTTKTHKSFTIDKHKHVERVRRKGGTLDWLRRLSELSEPSSNPWSTVSRSEAR